MIKLLNKILYFKFRFNVFFFIVGAFIYPVHLFSQETDVEKKVDPIITLTDVIQYSKATFKNNLAYEGRIFGYINGEKITEIVFPALDTFTVYTKQYDSLEFYSEFVENGKPFVLEEYYIKVLKNQPFQFKATPIMPLSGADLIVENSELKNLFMKDGTGKKLYEVTITDDVDPNWIIVEPLPEASQYIDIVKNDTSVSTYQVKIKNKKVFIDNLSQETMTKWKKGEQVRFPIGITMTDAVVPNQSGSIKYTLVKKKKSKKIKN